jgi:ATP-dependent protease ClpP protease subunit
MGKREVRCEACGMLNRVARYSISQIPRCGKPGCGAVLPESSLIRWIRHVSRQRRLGLYWLLIGAAVVVLWAAWHSVPIQQHLQTPPTQVASRESASVTGGVSCSSVAPGETESLGGFDLNIHGEIDESTVVGVSRLFNELHLHQLKEKSGTAPCHIFGDWISIDSPGGSVSAAIAIGRIFRKERAWIGVGDDGRATCVSACVFILAGAVQRRIGDLGTVGIHRPFLETPKRSATTDQVKNAYQAVLRDMRTYLREMNVAERLADDMLGTEPEKVHFLTRAELKAYGLSGVDPAEQQTRAIEMEVLEVQAAQSWGLDRREYNRRKALGDSLCPLNSENRKCKARILRTGQE